MAEEQIVGDNKNDKFQFGGKWFWIGMAVALFNVVGGLIYGIALIFEKKYRKEALTIIIWTIAWALIGLFIIGPWLVKSGLVPKFQMVKPQAQTQMYFKLPPNVLQGVKKP